MSDPDDWAGRMGGTTTWSCPYCDWTFKAQGFGPLFDDYTARVREHLHTHGETS